MGTLLLRRRNVGLLLMAAILAVMALAGAPKVMAEQQGQPPGRIPCFNNVDGMYTHFYANWEAPETGGEVTRYVAWMKPLDDARGKKKQPKRTRVTFHNLEKGEYYFNVYAKNEFGKGPRTKLKVYVGGEAYILPLGVLCDDEK